MEVFIKIKSKRMLFWVLLILVLLVSSYIYLSSIGVDFHMESYKEPYKVSEHFLLTNKILTNTFGKPIELNMINEQYSHIADEGTNFKFDIEVKSARENGVARIKVDKTTSSWKIVKAEVYLDNGEKIALPLQ